MSLVRRFDGIVRSAEISGCRRYRYRLTRQWGDASADVAFIGLNPSTADESGDDATTRKCVGFAKRWGFSTLHVINLFAWRDRHPRGLLGAVNPVGPLNDEAILAVLTRCDRVVMAWGASIPALRVRAAERALTVVRLLSGASGKVGSLGASADGWPRHPLMLPYATAFETARLPCLRATCPSAHLELQRAAVSRSDAAGHPARGQEPRERKRDTG